MQRSSSNAKNETLGARPPNFWAVRKKCWTFLLVGRFASRMQNSKLKTLILEKVNANLKFRTPIKSSVEIISCLSENCNFMSQLLLNSRRCGKKVSNGWRKRRRPKCTRTQKRGLFSRWLRCVRCVRCVLWKHARFLSLTTSRLGVASILPPNLKSKSGANLPPTFRVKFPSTLELKPPPLRVFC